MLTDSGPDSQADVWTKPLSVNITSCDKPSPVLCSPGWHVYRATVSGHLQACSVACGVAMGEDAASACAVTMPIMWDIEGVGPEMGWACDAAMEAS